MERLTVDYGKKFSSFRYAMKDGSDSEIGYFKNYDAFYSHMLMVQKLGEYEDLEEQGLLLRLPVKVGDTVYEVQKLRKRIQPYTIISIHISRCSVLIGWVIEGDEGIYSNTNGFCDYAIGKTVFLTKEEAEQKLKEMEGSK